MRLHGHVEKMRPHPKNKIDAQNLSQNVTSWDKISHMSQFFHMELNIPVFRPHPVLQIGEKQKLISCLYPKLLNFEIDKTENLKI